VLATLASSLKGELCVNACRAAGHTNRAVMKLVKSFGRFLEPVNRVNVCFEVECSFLLAHIEDFIAMLTRSSRREQT
jgi:hypothetical protein